MLPHVNGVQFLDETAHKVVHIYLDAPATGMGAFFFYGPISNWKQAAKFLPITQAFSTQVVRETEAEFNINVFKLAAIMLALQK